MKLTAIQHSIINLILQVDPSGEQKVYALGQLSMAYEIFKSIWKNIDGECFIEGEVDLSSEQKVFLTRLIEERNWPVSDGENVLTLKELLH